MDYTAILVAAVVSFIIGALWYSPMLFGKMYGKAVGHHGDGNKNSMVMMMVLEFIFVLVTVRALRRVMNQLGVATMEGALTTAFILWIGFILMNAWSNQMRANSNTTAMRISALCRLVIMLASAAIIISL